MFSNNFLPVSCKAEEIIKGCLLKIKVKYENVNFVFINVYGPTKGVDRMGFLNVLCHTVKDSCDDEYLFLCGDFNCTEPHRTSSCILSQAQAADCSCGPVRCVEGFQWMSETVHVEPS